MEQINAIADQFFALPYISSFFQSNAMLRIAANSYGTPLFLIFCALIFLIVLLLISKLMPKKGRPKPIKEDKPKKASRKMRRSRGEKKPAGTPKAILRKLEKLPESKLPLYPVADKKRRSLNESIDAAIEMDQPAAAAASPQIAPQPELPQPEMRTAAPLVAQPPADEIQIDDDQLEDFAAVVASATEQPAFDAPPQHDDTAGFDDLLSPPEDDASIADDLMNVPTQAPAATPASDPGSGSGGNDFGGGLTADDFDIDVATFGETPAPAPTSAPASAPASEDDDLSEEARRKFEELQQRGVTS